MAPNWLIFGTRGFSSWLIFGIRGFSSTRNRLAQVPSSNKIFLTPYRGYSILKKSIFSTFYFGSKLADFWYSGVFGHEKSIGASPEFRKNFCDPLSGVPHIKKINFFNFFILAPNWLIFGIRGFSGTRNRLAQVPSSKNNF